MSLKWSEVTQSCPTLCNPVDPPGSSIHGILQARILEWAAISFSRGSSWPRDRTQVSHIAGRRFILWANVLPVSFNMILPQFSLRATRHPVPRCVCWEFSPIEPAFVHLSSLLLKGPGWSPGLSLCLHFCTCFFSSLQDENRLNKLPHFFQTWWIPWTFFMYFVPHRLSNPYFSDLSYLILFYLTTYLSDLPFHIDYWSWIPEVSAYLTPKWQAMLLNLGYWLTRWKINHSHKLFELTNSVSANRAYRSPINPQRWKFDCFL